jgi:alanine dehydrogenase
MPTTDRTPRRAAFEVGKGRQKVLTLSEQQVAQLLDPAELLLELEKGFGALARGEIQCPPRPQIRVPGKGFSLSMAAWQPGMQICVKIVNVFDGNLEIGLPNHLAVINLFDSNTGAVTCVMDATHITAVRTAASAMVSHKLLSRPESRIATIVGAGVQAREHLRLLALIRDFDEILISSLDSDHAEGLATLHPKARAVTDLEESIRRSHVICLTTHSTAPVIQAEWVKPGTHVSSVGYHPPLGELPTELAHTSRLFVETQDAFAPPPVGCAELAGIAPSRGTSLGEVVNDPKTGRRNDQEITVYKSMGNAMEDMIAANLAYRTALATGAGGEMDW